MPCPIHKLRPGLPSMPYNICLLPIDERGYPIPWFVSMIDGKPEFRAADARKIRPAIEQSLCWVCGRSMEGEQGTFVIGPMCAINRISAEPPSHRACAIWSAKACPFLSKPKMVRRENDLPESVIDGPGVAIRRNPGVTLLWRAATFSILQERSGWLFQLGDPLEVLAFTEGRPSTPEEIQESIRTGLPLLRDIAEKDGPEAVAFLSESTAVAEKVLGLGLQ